MEMVFIKDLVKINSEKVRPITVFFFPFDDKRGTHMSEEQMKQEGLLIEKPARLEETGAEQIIYYNPTTQKCFYEYATNVVVSNETIQLQIDNLGQQLSQQKLLNIQKDSVIEGLGKQVSDLKLQIIKLQGGTR